MMIQWLGHSCFLLESAAGTRILTDPPDPDTGYRIAPVRCDAVTVSHAHHDHAYVALAEGAPRVITEQGVFSVKDVTVTGVPSYHDDQKGALRGGNMLYLIEIDGIRVLHAGDLGHTLDDETLALLGRVDVLLIPVGGVYTLDYRQALAAANSLHPKVVIPMHYMTKDTAFQLDELPAFLDSARNCAIHKVGASSATLTPESLGNDRILVLDHSK